MTSHSPTPSPGLPILGVLSPVARIALLATLGISVVGIALDVVVGAPDTVVFIVSGIAILGLAWIVGLGTERLGSLTGPQVGGILNATFGNIAELIIAFFALQAGLLAVGQGSLTRSVIRHPPLLPRGSVVPRG